MSTGILKVFVEQEKN